MFSNFSSPILLIPHYVISEIAWSFIFQAARAGQSTTLVGSRLIMFGGEDRSSRLLNDVNVLDLETMTWDVMDAS